MYVFANPQNFMRLSGRALPWLVGLSALTLVVGLALGFDAPADYQQGETVKIMFIHVPAAWVSTLAYCVMTGSALGTLVWRHPLAEASQKAAAPLGAGFAFICLVTGSLWGKPMWGTYWVWDARLTSMLVLFLTYLGLLALWHTIEEPGRAARAASVLTLVGAIDLPIIKFSVDWWKHAPSGFDLHQHRLDRGPLDAGPASHHGRELHADLRGIAHSGDPQRGVAPQGSKADARLRRGAAADGCLHPGQGDVMSGIPHFGFIVAAYAVTVVVMLAMVIAVLLDGRAQRRLLAKLETRSGAHRAGAAAPGDGSA